MHYDIETMILNEKNDDVTVGYASAGRGSVGRLAIALKMGVCRTKLRQQLQTVFDAVLLGRKPHIGANVI